MKQGYVTTWVWTLQNAAWWCFRLCKGRVAKRVVFHHTIQQYAFYGTL